MPFDLVYINFQYRQQRNPIVGRKSRSGAKSAVIAFFYLNFDFSRFLVSRFPLLFLFLYYNSKFPFSKTTTKAFVKLYNFFFDIFTYFLFLHFLIIIFTQKNTLKI